MPKPWIAQPRNRECNTHVDSVAFTIRVKAYCAEYALARPTLNHARAEERDVVNQMVQDPVAKIIWENYQAGRRRGDSDAIMHGHLEALNKAVPELYGKWVGAATLVEDARKKMPAISTEIAKDIMAIIDSLGSKFSYRGYTYRDEMIGDAVLNACRYLHLYSDAKIKVSKSGAFTFISFVAQRVFNDRIAIEKRGHEMQLRMLSNAINNGRNQQWWKDGNHEQMIDQCGLALEQLESYDLAAERRAAKKAAKKVQKPKLRPLDV